MRKAAGYGVLIVVLASFAVHAAPSDDPKAVLPSTPPVSAGLAAIVQEALERNPEIQAARRSIEAARARIPQARAWPDPKVVFSYGGNAFPPFTLMRGDPSSQYLIMAEQDIPYPGKTKLRGQIATQEASAEQLNYEATWRRVVAEVKQAYFDLYFIDRSLATVRADRELLEKFEKIAQVRYSVAKAAQQDVYKAQVELSRLNERQTMLEQARGTLVAQLNSLRNLPVDAPMSVPPEVLPNTLVQTLADLETAAQANYPVLKGRKSMVEANRAGVELAKRNVRPDFTVGYAYMQRAALPDMYGITFSISLPVYHRTKQDQAIMEAAANLESSRRMADNELATLRYRVKQEYLAVQTTDSLLALYSKGIVPQSSLALESSLASYETGTTDFLSVLTNFTTVLDYELSYHQQLAEHEKALARLEELTALDLIH
jgi:outer membrane protein TolC